MIPLSFLSRKQTRERKREGLNTCVLVQTSLLPCSFSTKAANASIPYFQIVPSCDASLPEYSLCILLAANSTRCEENSEKIGEQGRARSCKYKTSVAENSPSSFSSCCRFEHPGETPSPKCVHFSSFQTARELLYLILRRRQLCPKLFKNN